MSTETVAIALGILASVLAVGGIYMDYKIMKHNHQHHHLIQELHHHHIGRHHADDDCGDL